MAIAGGAVLTPFMGVIADKTSSVALAYGVPLFGYVLIACYSYFAQLAPRQEPAVDR
jgi:fucose permease